MLGRKQATGPYNIIVAHKIQKLNETQSKFDLDYFDYVNVGGYEQRERIANSLAQ